MSESDALRLVVEGTASGTGVEFFRALVKNLAAVMGTAGAWVTEYLPEARRLRAHAFWLNGVSASLRTSGGRHAVSRQRRGEAAAADPRPHVETYPAEAGLRVMKAPQRVVQWKFSLRERHKQGHYPV
jgi:hypothetical protein